MSETQIEPEELIQWHTLESQDVLRLLQTDMSRGLDESEASRRTIEYGLNELIEAGAKNPGRILWEQLTAVMVLILLAAAAVSAIVGDLTDAIVILAIVVLFTLLGFVQEYRAERAMAALKKLAVPLVRVRRSAQVQEISARELVPGDVVLLEAGNKVPADCRLVESVNLWVQEAALTGESEPVEKDVSTPAGEQIPLGDRRNMAYAGTVVTYGRGVGVVVETAMRTQLGRIAGLIQEVKREYTPLQTRLDHLGKTLGLIAVAVAGLIFGLGLLRGEELSLMLMTAVSVAVAAVPEGLPAVVTITLAIGAQRMLRRHALIRKLPAVETLGSVTVICSDKTGTLTENRMTVTVLDVAGHRLDLSEQPHRHALTLVARNGAANGGHPIELMPDTSLDPALALLLMGAALCNDAAVRQNGDPADFEIIGDPTEGALLVAAARVGFWKTELDATFPRVAELPFDSQRRRMTTVHELAKSAELLPAGLRSAWRLSLDGNPVPRLAVVKGSVDTLLGLSSSALKEGRTVLMTGELRKRVSASNDELASRGMRVIGVAVHPLGDVPTNREHSELESDLTFVGIIGIVDPPRPEVREAVRKCQSAGIRPVMITGDHPLTACYIARDLGIAADGSRTITGLELDRMSDEELLGVVEDVSVFARVSPEHKFRIVSALQARGHVVAMTGDGVNDAPALKKANIGVAMGITGTDVSKEAAEMVLRDDNFATIVAAVEEGRTIYDNIRKFIKYSIGGNIGKIMTVMLGPLIGMPLPLLPLQLLWLNLLTDGLLGLGLGVERPERDVMRQHPHAPGETIFARGMGRHVLWLGLLIAVVALGGGYWYWAAGADNWQTMIFTTLAFLQVGQALAVRSSRHSLFRIGIASNPLLLAMAITAVGSQLAVIYLGPLRAMFGTKQLMVTDLAISAGLGSIAFVAIEIEKWLVRRAGPTE